MTLTHQLSPRLSKSILLTAGSCDFPRKFYVEGSKIASFSGQSQRVSNLLSLEILSARSWLVTILNVKHFICIMEGRSDSQISWVVCSMTDLSQLLYYNVDHY